ncbi:MAG: class I SAM-dependent methyltransferase [Anaerolineae bacterium]
MEHADHVALLRAGVDGRTSVWADLGSGTGAFTLALADLLGAASIIYSVDRDANALVEQRRRMRELFPHTQVRYIVADYTQALTLPTLDGLLMANALHFQRDKVPLLRSLVAHLRPGGRFVLVEYDSDHGNPWVPYPISYGAWEALAERAGLEQTRQLARKPSRFLGAMYSALSLNPAS